jgi:hypothetical protein
MSPRESLCLIKNFCICDYIINIDRLLFLRLDINT